MPQSLLARVFELAVGIGWAVLVGAGFFWLDAYRRQAGAAPDSPSTWPAETQIHARDTTFTLTVFVDPRCPCSQATLREVERIQAACRERLAVAIVQVGPEGLRECALPGASVFLDPDAVEAERFGIRTSGTVLLVDPQGQIVFQGGITAGRGHEGDNAGKSSILALVAGQHGLSRGPVYGCPLGPSVATASTRSQGAQP